MSGASAPFAVLLPVWDGDAVDALELAFTSAVQAQTRRPAQVVLTVDGPVRTELAAAVSRLAADSPVPVDVLRWETNLGLGPALNRGLAACRHDIVGRMDADDYAVPERFAMQVPLVEAGCDVVGSAIAEFDEDPAQWGHVRVPPLDADRVRRGMALRQTVNHPSVVYRRSVVLAAGGYPEDLPRLEDYLLFATLARRGARMVNVPEPLLRYRVGRGAHARRGGLPLLRSELRLQRRLRRLGVVGPLGFLRNLAVRGGYRLLPQPMRVRGYRLVTGRRSPRG